MVSPGLGNDTLDPITWPTPAVGTEVLACWAVGRRCGQMVSDTGIEAALGATRAWGGCRYRDRAERAPRVTLNLDILISLAGSQVHRARTAWPPASAGVVPSARSRAKAYASSPIPSGKGPKGPLNPGLPPRARWCATLQNQASLTLHREG